MSLTISNYNLTQATLLITRPFGEGSDVREQMAATESGTLGRLFQTLSFAMEVFKLERGSKAVKLIGRVEFAGVTLRAVCAITWHLFTSAILAVATAVTMGRVEKLRGRLTTEFAHVKLNSHIAELAAQYVVNPTKGFNKIGDWIGARYRLSVNFLSLLPLSRCTDIEAMEKAETAGEVEKVTAISTSGVALRHRQIAALNLADLGSRWRVQLDTSVRYALNTLYAVATMVWNAFSMAILGVGYLAMNKNETLKKTLDSKAKMFQVNFDVMLQSAKGVIRPDSESRKYMNKSSVILNPSQRAGGVASPHRVSPASASASQVEKIRSALETVIDTIRPEPNPQGGYQGPSLAGAGAGGEDAV